MKQPTMTELTAIIDRFKTALRRAEKEGLHLPNGATLATVGSDGAPSSRVVLLKDADERGFAFYTNMESRKSRELQENPKASLCFWWPSLVQQIRVEGEVKPVADAEADAYWETRPQYQGRVVPRPPFWSGFCLVPERIEFWTGHDDRLHNRELYTPSGGGWQKTLLSP
jgi:pyridoxamine 5'-phosphate oxidase